MKRTRPVPVIVELDDAQYQQALELGQKRCDEAKKDGKQNKYGLSNAKELEVHLLGACGESAVAVAMGVPFDATCNTYKTRPDIGPYEVRTRSKAEYELLVRPDDKDESIYILARCFPKGQKRSFAIVGWIRGGDAKKKKWRHRYGGRSPAYFVPDEGLNSMKTLTSKSSIS